ncbi:hypothetical protein RRG08_015307 [Elysia crispata]|uniref:Guanylate cyclase domain-containing protein n=1 Tax=Elysia crispata TaxID=231223 RepID=A0AAE0ZUU2_9GAST|nr:hypothetical protein RRG08_015307 [Elysia crispata]
MLRRASEMTSRTLSRLSILQHMGLDTFYNRCNFGTRFGQILILSMLLVVGFLPSSILTVQNILKVLASSKVYSDNVWVTQKLTEIGRVVHEIQIERGRSTLFLTVSSGDAGDAWQQLLEQRTSVDSATNQLTQWPDQARLELGTLPDHKVKVEAFRRNVETGSVNYSDTLAFYSNINRVLINWMGNEVNSFATGDAWADLTAFHFLTLAKENMGVERARGSAFWNAGYFSKREFIDFFECQTRGNGFLKEAVLFSNVLNTEMSSRAATILENAIQYRRNLILLNDASPSVDNASQWFSYMTLYIDLMDKAQNKLADEIFQRTMSTGDRADSDMMITCFLLVIELAIYPLFVYLSVRLVTRIKTIGSSLASKSRHLFKEQRRNTEMVSQMYPKSIALKLLSGENIEPEIFEQATVCFSVLTDFDDIINVLSAEEAITVLNRVLEIMEDEILKYDVFKVETREDMVLLASGVPRRTPRNCEEIADLCLSLRTRMRSVCLGLLPSRGVRIKSGFCTGSVAAGIVGVKMPRYLLFGDTVNTAARMQSTSNGIQVAPSSGEILSDLGVYKLEQRDLVQIKGKGEMYTYWLMDKRIPHGRSPVLSAELY